jgi:hypothetical protein
MTEFKTQNAVLAANDAVAEVVVNTNVTGLPEDAPLKCFEIKNASGEVVKIIKARSQEDVLLSNE